MATSIVTSTKTSTSVNVTNKPDVLAAVARIKELKAAERAGKAAEAERKALEESVILPALNGATEAIVRGITVFKLSSPRKAVIWDTDALLIGWPEVHDTIRSEKPYRFITYS